MLIFYIFYRVCCESGAYMIFFLHYIQLCQEYTNGNLRRWLLALKWRRS